MRSYRKVLVRGVMVFGLILVCVSCAVSRKPFQEGADAGLTARVWGEVRELERLTGLRVRLPLSVRVVESEMRNVDGMYFARSGEGGAAVGWLRLENRRMTMYLVRAPYAGERVPQKVIRHEALHAVLVSNGIVGHPERFGHLAWKWD